MDTSSGNAKQKTSNQNIQVYVRVRPLNARERCLRSAEVIDVVSPREIITRHSFDSKLTKKFTFDRSFGQESRQVEVYSTVVAPLIEEVLSGYNCTVFAYGQTGTGKTHTMVGTECAELKSSWEDDSEIGIIPRALSHLFDELRLMELEFSMRISYLELYNEELCDLLSSDDSTKIRIFDDTTKKGSVIIQGLEEIPVHSKDDVYKLLEKGKERRKTATTLMNAQSSRSHTVFSIQVHIRENSIDGEEMLKIGKLNLVDLAGSENVSKAGNEKGIRVRETVNINQSLLTLGRVITALVERTPHIPYRESKLTRLLQESLGGRTKTSIIATISPGHKDIEETLSTLEYAHRAKNIQNKPEVNQKLTKKTVLKEYTEEIDKLKRDLMAARDKNGIYLAEETYTEMTLKMDSQNRELNEKMLLLKALKDELSSKEKVFNEITLKLLNKTQTLQLTEKHLTQTKDALQQTKMMLSHTKRRYKEKKVLLESHVKTEEELTNQATQILGVADVATNDTHQLHNTIERRKDVDSKIRTACECFSQRMDYSFKSMSNSFAECYEKHRKYAQMVTEEISNSSKIQQKICNDANTKIKQIIELFDETQAEASALSEKHVAQMNGLSVEHKILLEKHLQELMQNQLAIRTQLQTNLNDLIAYNNEQRAKVDAVHSSVTQMLQDNTHEIEAQTNEMKKQIAATASISETSLKELAQMQVHIRNEHELIAEEQAIMDEFMAKMKTVQEKRLSCLDGVGRLTTQQEQSHKHILAQCNEQSECGQAFAQKRRAINAAAEEQFVLNHTKVSLACIDQSDAKCANLQMQLENFSADWSKQIEALTENEGIHCQQAQEVLSEYESAIKRMRLKNSEKFTEEGMAMRTELADNSNRLKNALIVTGSGVVSIQDCMTDYAKLHSTAIDDCMNKVDMFKKSELKIYTPTGATPSKKPFVYPRVLSATSPHNQILQRLRQENDWSDLDTTATTIDEECSELEPEQVHSVQDISDAETILNSTPIDALKSSNNDNSGSSCISSNVLKVAPHLRNSSLTRNQSSFKRLSAPVSENNKENIS